MYPAYALLYVFKHDGARNCGKLLAGPECSISLGSLHVDPLNNINAKLGLRAVRSPTATDRAVKELLSIFPW